MIKWDMTKSKSNDIQSNEYLWNIDIFKALNKIKEDIQFYKVCLWLREHVNMIGFNEDD